MLKIYVGLASALFASLALSVQAASSSDELWDVTTKMDMPGMPAAVPLQSIRVCVPKGKVSDPERSMPKEGQDSKCKITDVKIAANKSSWKMHCEGREAMTGSGEMTYSADSYHGVVKTSGNFGGKAMQVTQVMDGRRVGTCQAK